MKSTPHFLHSVLNSTQEIKKWPDNGSIDCSQQPYVNLLENWEASNRWILWLIKIFYLYYWQAGALDNLLQAFNSYVSVQKLTKCILYFEKFTYNNVLRQIQLYIHLLKAFSDSIPGWWHAAARIIAVYN